MFLSWWDFYTGYRDHSFKLVNVGLYKFALLLLFVICHFIFKDWRSSWFPRSNTLKFWHYPLQSKLHWAGFLLLSMSHQMLILCVKQHLILWLLSYLKKYYTDGFCVYKTWHLKIYVMDAGSKYCLWIVTGEKKLIFAYNMLVLAPVTFIC